MLSQGAAAIAPEALWCAEFLNESPKNSTWTYSKATVGCAAPQYHDENEQLTWKRPLSVLPNNNGSDSFSKQPPLFQPEDLFAPCKNPSPSEDTLNCPQRMFVPVDLDKTIHWDDRALESLLKSERLNCFHFKHMLHLSDIQNEPNYPVYRAETVKWMMDVCAEESCDFEVFPLAVAYLNRVLFERVILPHSLQALASACLFIASKMKAPHPLKAKRISQFTDGFVTLNEILEWEVLVVNLLNWDISYHTIFEFFDQIMVRAPHLEFLRDSFCTIAHSIQLDETLSYLLPSVQCALGVCLLTMDMEKCFDYRKLIQFYLKVEFTTLKPLLLRLNPKLSKDELEFMKPLEPSRHRYAVYENTNPFVALV